MKTNVKSPASRPPKKSATKAARAAANDSLPATEHSRDFGRRLRAWYRANSRDLPWRRTRDPYHVLVSELMLQQTQVSRVVPKYHEFLGTFPTLGAIARATPARVMEAWSGLGYYARARNLHRLALTITHPEHPTGSLPPDPAELRELPGIGAYTAGAVACFAYERRAPLVDTNVARVLRRVFAPNIDHKSGRGARAIWRIAEATLPRTGNTSWTHNQALMELGALVCTARVRHCTQCPVRTVCLTRRNDLAAAQQVSRPVALERRARPRQAKG
jgi:A/G-specific adenine glycosylase